MPQELKYTEAMQRLQEIVNKMENRELDIDAISKDLKEARQLIKFCKDKLLKTEEEVKQILQKE